MLETRKNPEIVAQSVFQSLANVADLKNSTGVFYISDMAWIFDTHKALREFALVTHLAIQKGIQLHVFRLDTESFQSHMASYPRSSKLEAFLASQVSSVWKAKDSMI